MTLAWIVSASLTVVAAGCVERPTNVSRAPDASAARAVDNSNAAPSPDAMVPFERRPDGAMVVAFRAPVRECDDQCMRTRGGSMLRLLRLAYRMPDRMRRVLQALDMPYARLWMAWIANDSGDEADARTYLAEARALLRRDEVRSAMFRSALQRATQGEPAPTLTAELVAEMRTQLDHWQSLDPELGAEASRVLPCALLARGASAAVLAFRPANLQTDLTSISVVNRCADDVVDDVTDEAKRAETRAALTQLSDSIMALAPRTTPAQDAVAALNARVREPLFSRTFAVATLEDAALTRFVRTPSGAAARATLAPWLRARTPWLASYQSVYCPLAQHAQPTLTEAQCSARLRSAINAAAQWWIAGSANVSVGEAQRDR